MQPTVACEAKLGCTNCTHSISAGCLWNINTETCLSKDTACVDVVGKHCFQNCENAAAAQREVANRNVPEDYTATIVGGVLGGLAAAGAAAGFLFWKRKTESALNKVTEKLEMGSMSNIRGSAKAVSKIDFDSLTMGRKLGQGAFGEVKQAIYQGQDVAVKMCTSNTDESKEEFQKEIDINALLPPHTNVVTMLGVARGSCAAIIMELYPLCSIEDHFDRVNNHQAEDQSFGVMLKFAIDASAGLVNLHDEGVIHSDIACRNVLIKTNFAGAAIADFGLSKQLQESQTIIIHGEKLPVNTSPPEVMCERKFSRQSDVYMFGLFLWELFARCSPFTEYQITMECAASGKWGAFKTRVCDEGLRPSIPDDWPPALRTLISSCWAKNPSVRPTISSVNAQLRELQQKASESEIPTPSCVSPFTEVRVLESCYYAAEEADDGVTEEKTTSLYSDGISTTYVDVT